MTVRDLDDDLIPPSVYRRPWMFISDEDAQAIQEAEINGDLLRHANIVKHRARPFNDDADSQDKSDFVRRLEDRMGLDD